MGSQQGSYQPLLHFALLLAPVVFALYDAENLGVLSKRGMLSVLQPGDDQACVEAAFRTVSLLLPSLILL